MTIRAKNRTYAALARRAGVPEPTYNQTEQRDRRRQGFTGLLGGGWSLSAEVAAICSPLANRCAERGAPRAFVRYVEDVADAVAELIFVATGLLAEADAQRRTRHLPLQERERARIAIRALTPRPQLPEIASDDVGSGTWATALATLAEPYSADLARLLGNAASSAVSDRLLRALAEVDHAARALERRLDRDDRPRSTRSSQTPISEADRARAELESLGVSL
ncbi:hypothetical protein A7U43_13235 [Mycobacterium adipatum]|uniref:Uncharacterized protein n=1 Tax=Mycobacterium adipatum TaxID=1682113 RepID=A0A172UM85_9MYCO|nr:hypothetical protein [Mycobacterium adipatum]ANE80151.1 hypothetical protein A7U43_13235 [Mycobacterium adipatum]